MDTEPVDAHITCTGIPVVAVFGGMDALASVRIARVVSAWIVIVAVPGLVEALAIEALVASAGIAVVAIFWLKNAEARVGVAGIMCAIIVVVADDGFVEAPASSGITVGAETGACLTHDGTMDAAAVWIA